MAVFPRKRAILIGVDNYKRVSPLAFCGADVREIGRAFRESLQFSSEDILELTPESPYKPERNEILHHLGEFLKRQIADDELLVFYFAGHGMIDEEENKDYLLPLDASPNDLSSTGIKVEYFVKRLTQTKCKNIVMFIDACREAIEGARAISSIGADTKEAVQRHGVVTFFACDPKEKSYEIQALKHGSFTHCVLDAIAKGECDTVDDIDAYLRKEVPLINEKYEKPAQRPYTIIEPREKGQLAIFLSETRLRQSGDKCEICKQKLADLYVEKKISANHLNEGLILLERSKSGILEPLEAQRLTILEQLSSGILNPLSFVAVWAAIGRYQLKPAALPKQLDRLQ
jgi:uncharacterized caspase-like protein